MFRTGVLKWHPRTQIWLANPSCLALGHFQNTCKQIEKWGWYSPLHLSVNVCEFSLACQEINLRENPWFRMSTGRISPEMPTFHISERGFPFLSILTSKFGNFPVPASFVPLKLRVILKTSLFFVWILPIFWMLMLGSLHYEQKLHVRQKSNLSQIGSIWHAEYATLIKCYSSFLQTAPTDEEAGQCDHVFVSEIGETPVVIFQQGRFTKMHS